MTVWFRVHHPSTSSGAKRPVPYLEIRQHVAGARETFVRQTALRPARPRVTFCAFVLAPWVVTCLFTSAAAAVDLRPFFLGKAKGSGFGGDPILLWPDEGPTTPRSRSVDRTTGVVVGRSYVMQVWYAYLVQGV